MIMTPPILYVAAKMKRRIKICRWFKRISHLPGRRPQVIEEVIESEDTTNSYATEEKSNKIDTEIITQKDLQRTYEDQPLPIISDVTSRNQVHNIFSHPPTTPTPYLPHRTRRTSLYILTSIGHMQADSSRS